MGTASNRAASERSPLGGSRVSASPVVVDFFLQPKVRGFFVLLFFNPLSLALFLSSVFLGCVTALKPFKCHLWLNRLRNHIRGIGAWMSFWVPLKTPTRVPGGFRRTSKRAGYNHLPTCQGANGCKMEVSNHQPDAQPPPERILFYLGESTWHNSPLPPFRLVEPFYCYIHMFQELCHRLSCAFLAGTCTLRICWEEFCGAAPGGWFQHFKKGFTLRLLGTGWFRNLIGGALACCL